MARHPSDVPRSGQAPRRPEPPTLTDGPRGGARLLLAGALIALGLGGEIAAARWLIEGRSIDALLLHAPAATAWVFGSIALDRRLSVAAVALLARSWRPGRPGGRADDRTGPAAAPAISGRALSA